MTSPLPQYHLSRRRLFTTELDSPVREFVALDLSVFVKESLVQIAEQAVDNSLAEPCYWSNGHGQPVFVTHGDTVVAVMMPVRDDRCQKDLWQEIRDERAWLIDHAYCLRQEDGDDE